MASDLMRVISLGAGVQSSALLLMANHGLIPDVEAAVFADTGWEPPAVYEHLAYLTDVSRIPVYQVSNGNIRADALSTDRRFASMPLYVTNLDGQEGMLRRQCTKEYKISPIRKWLQENRAGRTVELLMGISLDEWQRMRDSDRKYVVHRYPLIDMRLDRLACLIWLVEHGYRQPPRSACIGCPYHTDHEWRSIRESPALWADAVDFDRRVRDMSRIDGQVYLHASRVPLDEVDLSTPADRGQLSFLDECEGYCGL